LAYHVHLILHNKHANYQIETLIIEQTMSDYNLSSHGCKKLNIPGTVSRLQVAKKKKIEIVKLLILIKYLMDFVYYLLIH
jgi:hypothetical protein